MNPASRRLWRDIVEARPADFFLPGSLNLLRTFVEISVALEQLGQRMVADPDAATVTRITKLGSLQSNLGARLRLTIQSSLQGDRVAVAERAEPPKAAAPELLGGKASWRSRVN